MGWFSFLKSASKHEDGAKSFIGGRPQLPENVAIPLCNLCKASQTFFLQLDLSSTVLFTDHSLAVFACTACCHESHLIPPLLQGPLKGHRVPSKFLNDYQINFRLMLFPTKLAKPVEDYHETIVYQSLRVDAKGQILDRRGVIGRVGGKPEWLLEDESPGPCDAGHEFEFLGQIDAGLRFQTQPSAPRQLTLDLTGKPAPRKEAFYELFIGDALYFFGTKHAGGLVYVLPQI